MKIHRQTGYISRNAHLYGGDVAAVAREEATSVESHGVDLAELRLGRQQPLRLEGRAAAAAAVPLEQDGYSPT